MLYPTLVRMHETGWLIQWSPGINSLTNEKVHACAKWMNLHAISGLRQVLPAYDSLYVEFDFSGLQQFGTVWEEKVETWLLQSLQPIAATTDFPGEKMISIPVCFDEEMGTDLGAVAAHAGLSNEEVTSLFTTSTYQVFMLGFLPGFPYMGMVDEKIAMARKKQPVPVKAGAVGIAGLQTGIYPVNSPGGWHIVGHTPLKMFDKNSASITLLQPGQQVQFHAIDIHTYHQMKALP